MTTNPATRSFLVVVGSGIDVGKEEVRMPTKKQHFVPRVYMKAWETQVETLKEPDKKFNGIYVIKDGSIGDGANRNSVLWKPHLYTINFSDVLLSLIVFAVRGLSCFSPFLRICGRLHSVLQSAPCRYRLN